MNIFDYNFARLYYWYQRFKKNFDHENLSTAGCQALTIYFTLIIIELMFGIIELFMIKATKNLTSMMIMLAPITILVLTFSKRYENLEKSNEIILIYSELEKESHERLRSSTWLWFWIIQLFCLFCFFYHSSIVTSVINQLKNYF